MINKNNKNKYINLISPKPQKTILNRAINGIVSGWNIPILPEKIVKFNRIKYVRIFRVIGALSTFYILSGLGIKSYLIIYYVSIALSLPYVIYRIFLVFFIIIQYISNINNGKYTFRDSSLDKLQTIFKFSMGLIKTIFYVTVGTGFAVALMFQLDNLFIFNWRGLV